MQVLQRSNGVFVETAADGFGRHAADNGVRGNVLGDEGAGADDGAIANGNASEDDGFIADPHIVANDDVALIVPGFADGGDGQIPFFVKYGKRIAGKAAEAVVGTVDWHC